MTDYANDVWSAAGRLALIDERLIAAGEIAVSRYIADRGADSEAEWGTAAWFALSFTPLRNELSILAAWERVDPAFVGAMGAYSADRETMSIGARYTPSDAFTATAYFRYYEGLVTDYYGAEYHAVTRDPAVTLTWRPFMYDPGSRFTNLALDCTISYTSERSTDPGNTVSFERVYAHLGLTDTRGPWRFGAAYDLEQDDDLTATDLDTLANTVTLSLGWRHEADRYTLSTDLMAQVKLESVDDNVGRQALPRREPAGRGGDFRRHQPRLRLPHPVVAALRRGLLPAPVRRRPFRPRVRGPVRAGLPGGRRDNRHPRDRRAAAFRGLARSRAVLRGGSLWRLRAPGVLNRRM